MFVYPSFAITVFYRFDYKDYTCSVVGKFNSVSNCFDLIHSLNDNKVQCCVSDVGTFQDLLYWLLIHPLPGNAQVSINISMGTFEIMRYCKTLDRTKCKKILGEAFNLIVNTKWELKEF